MKLQRLHINRQTSEIGKVTMSLLKSLRDYAKQVLFKEDIERLSESYGHLVGVLNEYPRTSKTQAKEDRFYESVSEFAEWDTQLADLIVRRMANQDYRKISLDDQTRMMIVDESRRLYVWDVTTQYMIELWTDYGFGQKPDIVPRSPELRAVWDEFWNADENQYIFNERKLNELSNKLQVDGEYWFVQFISKLDGQSTIRIIETDDIKDIYYDNDDLAVPVYYKRQWWTTQYNSEEHTLYYRDYRATDEQAESVRQIIKEQDSSAQFAEEQNINTDNTLS